MKAEPAGGHEFARRFILNIMQVKISAIPRIKILAKKWNILSKVSSLCCSLCGIYDIFKLVIYPRVQYVTLVFVWGSTTSGG